MGRPPSRPPRRQTGGGCRGCGVPWRSPVAGPSRPARAHHSGPVTVAASFPLRGAACLPVARVGLFGLLHCVRPVSVLPSGLRPCRSGGASSAALRPACACDRAGRSGGRSLAVPFAALRAGVSTRRSGRSGPARSGEIGLRPLGGFGLPPPGESSSCRTRSASPDLSASAGPPTSGWGAFQSAPRVKRPSLRRPRGPSARIAAGRRWP